MLLALAVIATSCQPVARRDHLVGPSPRDGRLVQRPWPKYSVKPGKEALRRWVEGCRRRGVARRPDVFGKAGAVIIEWAADRNGDLLRLAFTADSYRGWEVAGGLTLADCVVARARAGKIRWSRRGVAPLRLPAAADSASQPATAPSSAGPTSAPATSGP